MYVYIIISSGWQELTDDETRIPPTSGSPGNFEFKVMTSSASENSSITIERDDGFFMSTDPRTAEFVITWCMEDYKPTEVLPDKQENRIWEYKITHAKVTVHCNFIKVIDYDCEWDAEDLTFGIYIPKKYNADDMKVNVLGPESWAVVQRGNLILFNLKQQPLQIKTLDAADLGSGKAIDINLRIGDGNGKIKLKLTDPPIISLSPCSNDESNVDLSNMNLPFTEPVNIIVTDTLFIIRSSGKEVFNYNFPNSCVWRNEDISAIQFSQSDTASSQYIVQECDIAPAGYYMDGSRQECIQCAVGEEPNNQKDGCGKLKNQVCGPFLIHNFKDYLM